MATLHKIASHSSPTADGGFLLFLGDLKVRIVVIYEFHQQCKLDGNAVEEAPCFAVKEGSSQIIARRRLYDEIYL